MLAYAGVRSWAAFERRARAWAIDWSPEGITVTPEVRVRTGGFQERPAQKHVTTSADPAAEAAAVILGASAGQPVAGGDAA